MSDGVVRMIATSGFLTDRVHQIRFQPPPRWGSLQRSPRLSSWFNGDPTSKGKGREMEVGERGRPLTQIPGFAPDSVIHLAIMQPAGNRLTSSSRWNNLVIVVARIVCDAESM